MIPKIDVPIYETKLPLLKKTIKIRPFLVKEEKILMMAIESNDDDAIILAIKQIVNNCCIDEIDVESLPILDLEYLFLQLRARSIGENVELQYKCNNDIKNDDSDESHKCGNFIKINFNVLEVNPVVDEKHTNKIQLTDKLGVVMKYPTFKLIESLKGLSETEIITKTIVNCIDYIYDKENIYYTKDAKENEIIEFVDSLTKDQFGLIQNFFESVPKITKNIDFKCDKCGYEENLLLEGLQSFFV